MMDQSKLSPMMLQWRECKKAAEDAILFFRMGDFYEAFYEDAVVMSKELDVVLTKRQEIPMSGVPFHSSEAYIDRLVAKGYRVAIAEQIEDPKKAKGLVKRELVRVVTPGTLMQSALLSEQSNNYFVALTRVGSTFGIAALDVTTGEFCAAEVFSEQELANEIYRLKPAEILISPYFQNKHATLLHEVQQSYKCLVSTYDDWHFDHAVAHNYLIGHFSVQSLDGFGLKGMIGAINAAGALLSYLQEVLCLSVGHIQGLQVYSNSEYMLLDRATQVHLELTESLREGSRQYTLLSLLNHTKTPMGARLLKQWIKQPLLSVEKIHLRQDAVEAFFQHPQIMEQVGELFVAVKDIERLMTRVSSGCASPRDIVALGKSFEPMQKIKTILSFLSNSALIIQNEQKLDPLPAMTGLIARALVEDPPTRIGEGKLFHSGYNAELDALHEISRNSQEWLQNYQTKIREETGIKTLKVGFSRGCGYYIEVSKGQADRMPAQFQRRQTLTNAERFLTPELKEFEVKIVTAEERITALENELFTALRLEIGSYAKQVMCIAQAIAQLDTLRSFAELARRHHYVRPTIEDSQFLEIIEGRHPVIDACNPREVFVPNDTLLNESDSRLMILTGPNMAGKSTYIRQVALITIMAQLGSFIPAKQARIGIVDKVFTRIGASDDLVRGQSTFMVEMSETANILHNATDRSLVILDEIGRGTSTYDGISIAWAVAEQLLLVEGRNPKTLFATHYWEITQLEGKIPGAINYSVAVQEGPNQIIFLRKIVRGSTDKSYGIHVARLAGLPSSVINRAQELLALLEKQAARTIVLQPSKPKRSVAPSPAKPVVQQLQLSFFETHRLPQ